MAGMIQFRLNADYVQRFDALAARLGFNRTQVIRNLLSVDTILIEMIEEKAKTLLQVTIEDLIIKTTELPLVITIRLDKEFERRFNDLANSLGINRVQVLRNLLSGDGILVSGVCKKAKTIKLKPLNGAENKQLHSSQHIVSNQNILDPQDGTTIPLSFVERTNRSQVHQNGAERRKPLLALTIRKQGD